MESLDNISREAWDLFSSSPQEVQDLTYQFFRFMDINNDGRVDFDEIQIFLNGRNLVIQPPYPLEVQRRLFMNLDQDDDNTLNFGEFITFFYFVFLRAYCNRCGVALMFEKRRTCVECFMSAIHTGGTTYDLCRPCFHMHRYRHHHSLSQIKKYKDVIFQSQMPGASGGTQITISYGMGEPRQELFRRLFIAIQTAAAGATIASAISAAAGACSIL